ncbi:MAG: rnr [Myxococcaceae bacterium]|nr:rnr [Myxococcaceae bacterium]
MKIDSAQVREALASAGRQLGLKELLRALSLPAGQQSVLKRVLARMIQEGEIDKDGKQFRLNGPVPVPEKKKHDGHHPLQAVREAPAPRRSGLPAIVGTLHVHPDGFGFVHPTDTVGENVFLPPEEAKRAIDGDRVEVEVSIGRNGRNIGRILKVHQRLRQMVVGTYEERRDEAWVTPSDGSLGAIKVPKTQIARPGDAVKVRLGIGAQLLRERTQLTGEVAGSLGRPGDRSVEVLALAYAKGFHDEFPPEVMDEADQIALVVGAQEAAGEGRRDLRTMPLVTIDGEDARDFDDAICVETLPDGWRLVVAIADVSHYVRDRSALDAEALRRATSVYLPGRVLPMLPERLSNGICSLKPDEDRLCMVADMVIDHSGNTRETQVYPAVMKSRARCTYEEVHRVLAGEHVPGRTELKELFYRANTLAKTLTAMRLKRGAIDFDIPESKIELLPDGQPLRMVRRERLESHRLVEECMLAANEAVAKWFRVKGLPTVNRFHAPPDEDKVGMFQQLAGVFGVNVKSEKAVEPTSKELNAMLTQLIGHPEQRALNQVLLRSMMQAVYSSKNEGHYGLGAEDYLHFTSPIRRYPDLLVHRLLKAAWKQPGKRVGPALDAEQERLELLAVQASERERAAMQVEREVLGFYSCLMMKDRVGEELPGTVAALTDFGFFVELEGLFLEGLVRSETVGEGAEFDPTTLRIYFGDGRFVKVGMKVQVKVDSINFKRRQVDLELLTPLPFGPRKGGERQGGERHAGDRPGGGGGGRRGFEKLRAAGGKKSAHGHGHGKPSGGPDGHGKKPKGGFGGKKGGGRGGGRSRR